MDNGLVRQVSMGAAAIQAVLILVVVDNGLVQEGELFIWFGMSVLILVVVDNGLVHTYKKLQLTNEKS